MRSARDSLALTSVVSRVGARPNGERSGSVSVGRSRPAARRAHVGGSARAVVRRAVAVAARVGFRSVAARRGNVGVKAAVGCLVSGAGSRDSCSSAAVALEISPTDSHKVVCF